ncbi:DUF6879 family protein [Streptomyces massasporeus]|uniref:DUF6879 family protein n=1 Tax=Streptomyces massasporeus TaxID=67324 RepID=UPI00380B2E82
MLAGGVGYLLTSLTEQPEVWKLTVSILMGGAALTVPLINGFNSRLTSIEATLATHHCEMKEMVAGGLARLNEVTELFELVDRSALPREAVARLVRSATTAGTRAPAIVQNFVRVEITRLTTLLEDLSQEVADRVGEDQDWIMTLTGCAALTIDATSTWSEADRDLWRSELGARYLSAQRDAIERGVRIRRLFIIEEPEQDLPQLSRLREEQQRIGIDVRVLALSGLAPNVRLAGIDDFVVFDESLSYEICFDLRGVNARTAMYLRSDWISHRIQQFRTLWEASQ